MQHRHVVAGAYQRLAQPPRQGHPAVLAALAVAHHDLVAVEIDVLDPQPHAFHQAHPGAVQQRRHQPRPALQHSQQPIHLLPTTPRGSARPLGPDHLLHPRQLDPSTSRYRNSNAEQGLVLGARSHPPLDRKPGQETLHLDGTHVRGCRLLLARMKRRIQDTYACSVRML
jgi:hypothetical protein